MVATYSGVSSEAFYWSFLFEPNTREYLALVASSQYMDCFSIYCLSCDFLEHAFSVHVPKHCHQALGVMFFLSSGSLDNIAALSKNLQVSLDL